MCIFTSSSLDRRECLVPFWGCSGRQLGFFHPGFGMVSTLVFLSLSTGDTDHSWQPQCSRSDALPGWETKRWGCEGGSRGQTPVRFVLAYHISPKLITARLASSNSQLADLYTSWVGTSTPSLSLSGNSTSVRTAVGFAHGCVCLSRTGSHFPSFLEGHFSVFPLPSLLLFLPFLPCFKLFWRSDGEEWRSGDSCLCLKLLMFVIAAFSEFRQPAAALSLECDFWLLNYFYGHRGQWWL